MTFGPETFDPIQVGPLVTPKLTSSYNSLIF